MKLLVVEDEPKLGRAIKSGLEQDGYAVDLVNDYEDGLAYAETEKYDLIMLDRMLPGGKDGLDICKQIRKDGNNTPVLMLTARGELDDKVTGLDSGADDYLIKPFAFEELLARVRALSRRPSQAIDLNITIGDLTIESAKKRVSLFGSPIKLSKKEYSLLEYLAHHPNQVWSKDQLIEHVWDFDSDILPNTVEVFIRGIRKKLDKPGQDSIIETVRGFGYRIKVGR